MPRASRRKPETRRRRIAPLARRRIVVRNGLIAVVRGNSTKSLLANEESKEQADNSHGDHKPSDCHSGDGHHVILRGCIMEILISSLFLIVLSDAGQEEIMPSLEPHTADRPAHQQTDD